MAFVLSVASKLYMPNVIMLSVVMLNVVAPPKKNPELSNNVCLSRDQVKRERRRLTQIR